MNYKMIWIKIYNVARMVILKNLETGEIYNFIMVFIGTYDYLMHTTSFENNSYLHREADFDGKSFILQFQLWIGKWLEI